MQCVAQIVFVDGLMQYARVPLRWTRTLLAPKKMRAASEWLLNERVADASAPAGETAAHTKAKGE